MDWITTAKKKKQKQKKLRELSTRLITKPTIQFKKYIYKKMWLVSFAMKIFT